MVDIGVNTYPVQASNLNEAAARFALARVQVLRREAGHVERACAKIEESIRRKDLDGLAQALKVSRDWSLSVIMSHFYIQSICHDGSVTSKLNKTVGGATPLAHFQAYLLSERAGKAGAEEGASARRACGL